MKKEVKFFLIFIVLILLLNFMTAGFEIGKPSHSINEFYTPGSSLRGWINISFQDESTNSLFKTSQGESIRVIELISKNEDYEKRCIPVDCTSDYSEIGSGKTEKEFTLSAAEEKIIGLKFDRDVSTISSFTINITSDVTESELAQLHIDILNDRNINWKPYKNSSNFASENQGCFNPSDSIDNAIMHSAKYCQRVDLKYSPLVKIGANLIEGNGGLANFEMEIYHSENPIQKGFCEISVEEGGKFSCIPKDDIHGEYFRIKEEGYYYVCIAAKSSSDKDRYKIKYETINSCGYSGEGGGLRDFDLFVQQGKFSPIGNFILNNTEFGNYYGGEIKIENNIENYLNMKYGNECGSECILPIRFYSQKEQNIRLNNIRVVYTGEGITSDINRIYEIEESPARISSDFQKLSLDNANFSLPETIRSHVFSLNLNNDLIFKETISIKSVPLVNTISPKIFPAAYPIEFSVSVDFVSPTESLTYLWEFGDGTSKETKVNKVEHTYNKIGDYDLRISVKNSDGEGSSKNFTVNAITPKDALETLLEWNLGFLEGINSQIKNFDTFVGNIIKEILKLENAESKLEEIQKEMVNIDSDDDYVTLVREIFNIDLPLSIIKTGEGRDLRFISSGDNIDLESLRIVGGGEYETDYSSRYINSIISWNIENIDSTFTFETYSAGYEDYLEDFLYYYDIRIDEKSEREESYLIIYDIEDIFFKDDDIEEKSGVYYKKLNSESERIIFATTEEVLFEDLPAFISPSINKLSISPEEIGEWEDLEWRKWVLFGLMLGLIITLGIISYIIIGKWYQKKYEDYLFKNKNDLYNVVHYVHSAKKNGVDNKEIEKNLRKAKWNSEQVSYIMKKYAGKKIGLPGMREKVIKKTKKVQRSR